MLATLDRVLRAAQRKRYAVGAFNTSNLETTQAIIETADRLRSPVIVNVTEKAIAYGGLPALTAIVTVLAKRAHVPVVLNLDHGRSIATVRAALSAGFTGVMLDASRQPYAVNVRWTKTVVALAKKTGAGTEGELGVVAYVDEEITETDPWQAGDFVRRTGVDAFAVGIGNAHGPVRADEHLNFDRLRAIRKHVRVPLVLHGASGTKPAAIRRAIALGIAKINIDTDLRRAFTGQLRTALASDRRGFDPRSFLLPAREAVAKVVSRKIRMFGGAGRG
jgi:fructose-bisphosphate aldolase class II